MGGPGVGFSLFLDPLTQLLHVLQATTPVGSEADNCIVHDLTGHGPEHPSPREYTVVLPPGGRTFSRNSVLLATPVRAEGVWSAPPPVVTPA